MSNINDTLAQRAITHGSFKDHANISQHLKFTIRESDGYVFLSNVQKEALSMILHKIARIVNGNPNEPDHWHDISGYATLAYNEITEEKQSIKNTVDY